ncbi:hypothetical protein [Saccharopolyspora phatthalungensis]|uniref:hypothetical protein n=1 Tax=Saccharopolyspora phatthalungensis TaxID=664693 RepID=UPI0016101E16|nr:hypothetical protein [Saccharopolyspora phatthalungensis]
MRVAFVIRYDIAVSIGEFALIVRAPVYEHQCLVRNFRRHQTPLDRRINGGRRRGHPARAVSVVFMLSHHGLVCVRE